MCFLGHLQSLEEYCPDQLDMFFFGLADKPQARSLVEMRKHIGWFSPTFQSDKKHGIVGVGAIPYMTNFNVTIQTS